MPVSFNGKYFEKFNLSVEGEGGGNSLFVYLFIMATLKPRMDLDITPVSTFLAEWHHVMLR